MMSLSENLRVGVATSSYSSSDRNATRASARVRVPSCRQCPMSWVGTAVEVGTGRVGGAGFGAAGPFQA